MQWTIWWMSIPLEHLKIHAEIPMFSFRTFKNTLCSVSLRLYKFILRFWNMISYIKGGLHAKGIWKQDPDANIWTQEGWEWGVEKAPEWETSYFVVLSCSWTHLQRGWSLVRIPVLLEAVVLLTARYQQDESVKKDIENYFNLFKWDDGK